IKLVAKEERTAVSVRFYAASAQPRQVLDLLTRRIGWYLANAKAHVETGASLDFQAWSAARPAAPDTPRIVRRNDLRWQPSAYPDDPEVMGEYAQLTRQIGCRQLGADVHRLQPGQRSCRDHAETGEEEAFYVLSGSCKAEVEGVVHALAAGDFLLTFPGEAHFFFNDSAEPCEILMFGGPDLRDEGATFPHGRDARWRERTGAR
ncbi:MAG: cupin domain-containing protein, partial [Candidatus Sericytochromatia bacterium]|nr:cupin domain-containing protein [Candidatus Tanganyikabacteria bacterium]